MATFPAPTPAPNKQDPRTVVKSSTRLWSAEVAAADPQDALAPHETAYEFGNRRFVEKKRYGP